MQLWNWRVAEPPSPIWCRCWSTGRKVGICPDDYVSTMALLTIGGNDTTRNTITGGLYACTSIQSN